MAQLTPIPVVPYSEEWRYQFEREAARVRSLCDAEMHHIGSTSVPGCWAKPIIDIMVVVDTFATYAPIQTALVQDLGYESLGEYGVPGRDFLFRYADENFHISAFQKDDDNVARNLLFKDLLIDDPKLRDEYAELKRRLARDHGDDMHAYNLGKAELIQRAMGIA